MDLTHTQYGGKLDFDTNAIKDSFKDERTNNLSLSATGGHGGVTVVIIYLQRYSGQTLFY